MFAAGLTVGLAAERYALHRNADSQAGESGRRGGSTIERFADELGITPEQQTLIDPILVETRERLSAVSDRVRPEWEAVVDSARARIEAVLTPEQVTRYRALLDEQEERREMRSRESTGGSDDGDSG
jgi:Spy/CpxP family protein refolding chaperone